MKDIENWEFGSRNDAYTTNKHSGAISCVNSRCMTGRASVGEKWWARGHVIATDRVKKPWGELTRQDRKSRGRGCITSQDESLSDDAFQLICGECDGGSRVGRSSNSSGCLISITMSNSSSASIAAITSLNSVAMLLAISAKFVGFPIWTTSIWARLIRVGLLKGCKRWRSSQDIELVLSL